MKQLFYLVICLLIGIGLSGCAYRAPSTAESAPKPLHTTVNTDVLFIAYDYGDALAFKAVLPYLESHHVNVKVLVFGAAERALSGVSDVIALQTLFFPQQREHYRELIASWQTSRQVTLPAPLLEAVTKQINTRVVVTGMANAIQAQITNQLALKGTYAVAFYDNFDAPQAQPFVQPWLQTTFGVNELFLPGDYLINNFLKIKALSGSEITVVGQPALEDWAKSVNSIKGELILKQLSLNASQPIVVFAAGYDADSLHWLSQFLEVTAARPNMQVVIALHPKMRGHLETLLEQKVKALHNVQIAPSTLSTEQLAKVANIIVTHKSTVGVKAAYAGIPVLYVAEDTYHNILTEHHLAIRASSWSEILNALHRLLDRTASSQVALKTLGIPSQPVIRFDGRLLDILKGAKQPLRAPVLENVQFEKKQIPWK